MTVPAFDPREGGVKVVFDVLEDVVDDAVREITAAGDDGASAGDREPRRPAPATDSHSSRT
jgi:hypothetical protein